jgi:cbb3-type cytochrome oxidase subunit 3
MWVLVLEAGTALFLLIFIVWWTMFSGKKTEESEQTKVLPVKDDTPQ